MDECWRTSSQGTSFFCRLPTGGLLFQQGLSQRLNVYTISKRRRQCSKPVSFNLMYFFSQGARLGYFLMKEASQTMAEEEKIHVWSSRFSLFFPDCFKDFFRESTTVSQEPKTDIYVPTRGVSAFYISRRLVATFSKVVVGGNLCSNFLFHLKRTRFHFRWNNMCRMPRAALQRKDLRPFFARLLVDEWIVQTINANIMSPWCIIK